MKRLKLQTSNRFIVVVPVYNAEKYIEKCLRSILNQTYKNYELIVMNDASTDRTERLLKDFKNRNPQIHVFSSLENSGSPLNSFKTAIDIFKSAPTDRPDINPEDILVTVDGDDYLYDNNVLDYLNFIYQDTNIWMTYGQYKPLSDTYSNFCKSIKDFRKYRREGAWCTSHLRTLKKKIWDKINVEDLKDENGNINKYAGDMSYMFPALEICGPKHTKFIDRILYVYNDLNPDNQMKICSGEDLRVNKKLREMPMYDEL